MVSGPQKDPKKTAVVTKAPAMVWHKWVGHLRNPKSETIVLDTFWYRLFFIFDWHFVITNYLKFELVTKINKHEDLLKKYNFLLDWEIAAPLPA